MGKSRKCQGKAAGGVTCYGLADILLGSGNGKYSSPITKNRSSLLCFQSSPIPRITNTYLSGHSRQNTRLIFSIWPEILLLFFFFLVAIPVLLQWFSIPKRQTIIAIYCRVPASCRYQKLTDAIKNVTLSVTIMCFWDLMKSTASLCLRFSKFFPLTSMIWSPTWNPACSANEPASILNEQNNWDYLNAEVIAPSLNFPVEMKRVFSRILQQLNFHWLPR